MESEDELAPILTPSDVEKGLQEIIQKKDRKIAVREHMVEKAQEEINELTIIIKTQKSIIRDMVRVMSNSD